jgi:hypothetical protein
LSMGLAACSVDPTEDCLDEFVQEYVQEYPSERLNFELCPGQDIASIPDRPTRKDTTRIEYSGGDYFIQYSSIDWFIGREVVDRKYCTLVIRHETSLRILSFGGRVQMTLFRDGKERSLRDMDDFTYLPFGLKPLEAPLRASIAPDRLVQSEFGVECAWVDREIWRRSWQLGRACMPVSPVPRCPSFNMMAAFKANTEDDPQAPVLGRTVYFKYGGTNTVVDKFKWTVMQ